jgi:uncharacterized protein with GYD domain
VLWKSLSIRRRFFVISGASLVNTADLRGFGESGWNTATQVSAKGVKAMPTYISMMKATDQGAKDIKEAPSRVENAVKALEALGGKLVGFYVVMGEYDYIGIADLPDDQTAMTFLAILGNAGNVKTTTVKAFTMQEFGSILKKLP